MTGDDEVAVVARTFNAAAGRVEELLTSQKALLANASHELRSPLARLRMAIELWLERPGARDPRRDRPQSCRNRCACRRNPAGEPARTIAPRTPAPARRSILSGSRRRRRRASKRASCGTSAGGGPIEIEGDATLLRRLIRNLLENAAKHGRPPIRIEVTKRAAGARIVVADHGPGIAPSERERVFEPFYRPTGRSEAAGGWGLGLSLVRQIARRHGGAVSLRGRARRRQPLRRRSWRGEPGRRAEAIAPERRRPTLSAPAARRGNRKTRAASSCRASPPRHISPAADRGGIWNWRGPRAAPASPRGRCRGR